MNTTKRIIKNLEKIKFFQKGIQQGKTQMANEINKKFNIEKMIKDIKELERLCKIDNQYWNEEEITFWNSSEHPDRLKGKLEVLQEISKLLDSQHISQQRADKDGRGNSHPKKATDGYSMRFYLRWDTDIKEYVLMDDHMFPNFYSIEELEDMLKVLKRYNSKTERKAK